MIEWLPPLVCLPDYQGDFAKYLDAVYAYFKADFIDSKVLFGETRISLKRHPQFQNKEYVFWHITSEGDVETERIPDFRRCERIRWVKPIIENASDPAVKQWENNRKGDRRVCLWLEEEDYLVVLALRKDYILLWTAYMTNFEHTRQKLQREYRKSLKG
jgi:hypothetical protein